MPALAPELIPAAITGTGLAVGLAFVVFGLRGLEAKSVSIFVSDEFSKGYQAEAQAGTLRTHLSNTCTTPFEVM